MNFLDLTGQTLGQYELRQVLGTGGMGAVYRGYQAALKREVAVKVLPPFLAQQADYIDRFNREAETAAKLEHSHIVPIYDHGTQAGISYVVMRLLTGGSLDKRFEHRDQTGRPLPSLGEVARLLKQVGSALDYAHSQGVIHRDIKPSNIMFDPQGSAYIVDFGIAKLVHATVSLTGTGVAMGTPLYMSPEQWRAEVLTPAADQYALGVMAYVLVTGQPPFDAPTPYALMHKHVNEAPVPPEQLRPDLPPGLPPVLQRALAKNASDRFPNAAAYAEAFERAVQDRAGTPTGFFLTPLAQKAYSTPLTASPSGRVPPPVVSSPPPATTRLGWRLRQAAQRPLVYGTATLGAVLIVALLAVLILAQGGQDQDRAGSGGPSATVPPTAAPAIVILPSATPKPIPLPVTEIPKAAPTTSPTDTPTASPTATPTASPTPTATATATATPTTTPVPSATLDLQATAEAMLFDRLTQTAESWTDTPTPDLAATAEAMVIATMTGIAESWTDTPTATWTPTPTLTFTPTYTATMTATSTSSSTPVQVAELLPGNLADKQLVFVHNSQLYQWNASSVQGTLLVSTGENYEPEFVGPYVVFASIRNGQRFDVYVLDTRQGVERQITSDPAQDRHPTFSPDGGRVAFASDRTGNWDLYIVNSDGSGEFRLTQTSYNEYAPSWSPDGTSLAYQSEVSGKSEIYIHSLVTNTIRQMTSTPDEMVGVLWSPDGKTLACYSYTTPPYWFTIDVASGSLTNQGQGTVDDWLDAQTVLLHRTDSSGRYDVYEANVVTGAEQMLIPDASGVAVSKNLLVGYDTTPDIVSPAGSSSEAVVPAECDGFLPPRLQAGQQACVSDIEPNNIRTYPESLDIVGQIPPGAIFYVVDGPECTQGTVTVWWYVEYNGLAGWTAEGSRRTGAYWLSPLPCPLSNPSSSGGPDLSGTILEVTQEGGSLNARAEPSRSASRLMELFWGDRVLWEGDRAQGDGYSWYGVRLYDGRTAYIIDDLRYTVVRDPAETTPGMYVGATIRITSSGDEMHLRSEAGIDTREVQMLHADDRLTVLGGPVFADYFQWWELRLSDGRTGWAVDVPGWWVVE